MINTAPVQIRDVTKKPLSHKEVIGYGLGDGGQALIGTLIGFYQLYFFTDVIRLPLPTIATIFLATKLLDSAIFPVFGLLLDKWASGAGGFRRWLAYIILPFFVSSLLLFACDVAWPASAKVAYTYVVVVIFVVVSAMLSVIYSGLMSTIAVHASDRARLSTVRFAFAFGCSTLATLSIKYVVDFFGGAASRGFYYVAALFSLVTALALLVTYLTTTERKTVRKTTEPPALRTLLLPLRAKTFLIPLSATVFTGLFVSIKSQTTLYFIAYVMRREDVSNFILAAGTISCAAGVFFVGSIINKIDRKTLYVSFMCANAVFIGAIFFVDPASVPLVVALHCANSFVGGACTPVIFSIYSDVVDDLEATTGSRLPALVNSLAILGGRLGGSLGTVFIPFTLAMVRYQPGANQGPEALAGISVIFTLVPAALALAAGLVMLLYKITNSQAEATSVRLDTKTGLTPLAV